MNDQNAKYDLSKKKFIRAFYNISLEKIYLTNKYPPSHLEFTSGWPLILFMKLTILYILT